MDNFAHVTLKFGGWPRKKKSNSSILHNALCIISKPSAYPNWNQSPEMLNSGQIGDFFTCVSSKFDGWP